MEINTEMNKVFGHEMAKLFAATIDEEELKAQAQKAWDDLNKSAWTYGSRQKSEIQQYIQEQILNRLYNKIQEILEEPINEEILEAKAHEMVEKARKAGEEAIIKDMAYHMTENMLSIYSRNESIVQEVLARLNLQKENNRLY